MSIERIKELNKIATQMEAMKAKAIGEITDRKELRIQALKKIQEYLKELSKATEGCYWTAETPITIYWLVKQDEIGTKRSNGVGFTFSSSGEVNIYQYASASSLRINDFTNLSEFGHTYTSGYRWDDGMVELINRWKEIKPYIEAAAEKAMIERMTKAQKELADFKASYEKIANFEV
jgi:hypothetical protein